MDADQLPEEASRIDENRTVSQPKVNKRAREPSSIDDEAAKRSKIEPPQNPEPVETIEIEDDPEPELVEDEVVEVSLFMQILGDHFLQKNKAGFYKFCPRFQMIKMRQSPKWLRLSLREKIWRKKRP